MPCTTILVGKNASYDGSTLVARNEDSSNGVFEPKRMRVVHPDEQPRVYTSVLSHLTVELPDNPMRYTSVPDVVPGHGIWAEAGFNELNVGMSATETLTTNERVRERLHGITVVTLQVVDQTGRDCSNRAIRYRFAALKRH